MKPLAYLPTLLLLAACAPQETTTPASAPAAASTVAASQPAEPAASAASTAAQPDAQWIGRYYGVLPCASCEGIETTLILQEDGSYLLTETYWLRSSRRWAAQCGFEQFLVLVVVDRFRFMTLRALKTGLIFKKKMAHGMVTLLCLSYLSQKR